jgi:DNA polymerase-3 subunit gamma/tau
VFIIDEAHMVSNQGFNALLKIVEEPPPHVRFVFATTEPDRVIPTIRSRTHHYPFRLVPPDVLVPYLQQVCDAEGVAVGSGVLPLVVRAGAGSVRDSLSVLDQLIAGSGGAGLEYDAAVGLLGYTPATLLDDLVDAIAARDGATAFAVVERVIATGHEPRRFVEDLLERLRDLIVISASGPAASAALGSLPEDQLARMAAQAQHLGASELSRSADLANAALTEMVGATSPRLHLELLMARLLLPAADDGSAGYGARLDRLERGWAPGASSAAPAPTVAPAVPTPAASSVVPAPAPATSSVAPAPAPATSAPAAPARPVRETAAPTAAAPPASVASPAAARVTGVEPSGSAVAASGAAGEPAAPPAARVEAPDSHVEPAGAPEPRVEPSDTDVEPPDVEWSQSAGDTPSDTSFGSTEPHSTSVAPAPVPAGPTSAAAPARSAQDTEMLRRRWPEVLETVKGLRRVTWILVGQNAQVHDLDASVLRLSFPSAGMVDRFRDHADVVARAVRETLGFDVHVQAVLVGAPGSPAGTPATAGTPTVPGSSAGTPPHGIPSAEEAAASWDVPAPSGGSSAGGGTSTAGGAGGRSSSAAGRSSSDAGSGRSAARGEPGRGRSASPGGSSSSGTSSSAGRDNASSAPSSSGDPAGLDDQDDDPDEPPVDMPEDEFPEDLPPEDVGAPRPAEEDEPSPDDPLIEGSNLVGAPLVARLLGGTVIEEQVDEPR